MSRTPPVRTIVTLALAALAVAGIAPAQAQQAAPAAGVRANPATTTRTAAVKDAPFRKKVVGTGTPASCTYARLAKAVRGGGDIRFNCGPRPVTIVVRKTLVLCNTHNCATPWNGGKRVTRLRVDGGGKVTLSGGGKRGIFYANTCDARLAWLDDRCNTQRTPHVEFRRITFREGDATKGPSGYEGLPGGGGGGAIAMRGGRLTVRDATFVKNRCVKRHSDAGGGAIRVVGQVRPARIIRSTFTSNRCANGGAVSALQSPLSIEDSVFRKNKATGSGASSGKGGNGGAIYFDGTKQDVVVTGSRIQENHAPEGGPGIFYVSNDLTGSLTVRDSRITRNTGARFWTGTTKSIFFKGKRFTRSGSTIT